MAMIQGFLIAYSLLCTLLILYVGRAVMKRMKEKKADETDDGVIIDQSVPEIERILTETLKAQGIKVSVESVPKDPVEAIVSQTHKVINRINDSDTQSLAWFKHIR